MGVNRRLWKSTRTVVAVMLLATAGAACENPEKKARYVKEPFTETQQHDTTELNDAYREAKTRLASVRSDDLREQLDGDLEQEYQRRLAEIHEAEEQRRIAAAERAAREREAERARQEQLEAERQRQLMAQQAAMNQVAALERQAQVRQCIIDLEGGMRVSEWIEGTQVLQLRNACTLPVQFDLRCFTCNDATYKTMFITVPARGQKEIGFLEGWQGNFTGGERCEAHFGEEILWNRRIPGDC